MAEWFQVGLTVKKDQVLEFWYADAAEENAGDVLLEIAMRQAGLRPPHMRKRGGHDFVLRLRGKHY